MEVRFGNLSATQFNAKVGNLIGENDIEWLESHRKNHASFEDTDGLHIFDKPLGIVAGAGIVHEVIKRLREYDFETKFYVQERVTKDSSRKES